MNFIILLHIPRYFRSIIERSNETSKLFEIFVQASWHQPLYKKKSLNFMEFVLVIQPTAALAQLLLLQMLVLPNRDIIHVFMSKIPRFHPARQYNMYDKVHEMIPGEHIAIVHYAELQDGLKIQRGEQSCGGHNLIQMQ